MEIKRDFNIPIYLVDEIIEYIEETAKGRCRTMKWENIKTLLRLAQANDKLTSEQVNFIIEKYNRE